MESHAPASRPSRHGGGRAYRMFGVNMALSLVVMYLAMFTMIDGRSDFRNNLNTLYMALAMLAPMGMIMLATMRGMYPDRRVNAGIHAALLVVFIAAIAGTRAQVLIGDRQFIASMIPHHSGAILMCREAALSDPELLKLCDDIAQAQREEIDQMKAIRARLDRRGA